MVRANRIIETSLDVRLAVSDQYRSLEVTSDPFIESPCEHLLIDRIREHGAQKEDNKDNLAFHLKTSTKGVSPGWTREDNEKIEKEILRSGVLQSVPRCHWQPMRDMKAISTTRLFGADGRTKAHPEATPHDLSSSLLQTHTDEVADKLSHWSS